MKSIGLAWVEWFNDEKKHRIREVLLPILPFMRRNKLLTLFIRKWIREELGIGVVITEKEDSYVIESLNKWFKESSKGRTDYTNSNNKDKKEIINKFYTNESLLEEYANNEVKALMWAKSRWEDQIPQIYLEEKERYNTAVINTASVSYEDKGIAMEMYYALKEGEYSIEESGEVFGNKVKCTKGGIFVRLDETKIMMRNFIKRGTIGEITKPFRVEDRIVILEVLEYNESELNEEISNKIVKELLERFISVGIEEISDYLCSMD